MTAKLIAKLIPEILLGASSLGVERVGTLDLRHSGSRAKGSNQTRLTPSRVRALEAQTGRTVSELAVLGMSERATPRQRAKHSKLIEETCELLAQLDDLNRKDSTKHATNGRANRRVSTRKRSAA